MRNDNISRVALAFIGSVLSFLCNAPQLALARSPDRSPEDALSARAVPLPFDRERNEREPTQTAASLSYRQPSDSVSGIQLVSFPSANTRAAGLSISESPDERFSNIWGIESSKPFGRTLAELQPHFSEAYELTEAFPLLRFRDLVAVGPFPAMGLMWGIENNSDGSYASIWQWHDHVGSNQKALFLEFDKHVAGLAFPTDFEKTGVFYVATVGKKLRGGGQAVEVLQFRVDILPPFRLKTDRSLVVARGTLRSAQGDIMRSLSNGSILVDVGEGGSLSAASVTVRLQEFPKYQWNIIPIFDSLTGSVRSQNKVTPVESPTDAENTATRPELDPAWALVRVPPRLMLRDGTGFVPDRSVPGSWNKQAVISGCTLGIGVLGTDSVSLLAVDGSSGDVWTVPVDATAGAPKRVAATSRTIRALGVDSNQDPLLIDSQGKIYRLSLSQKDPPWQMPEQLSDTDWFESIAEGLPKPQFLHYGKGKGFDGHGDAQDCWVCVPKGDAIDATKTNQWNFPDGTVLLQTIYLDGKGGNSPNSLKRVETRVLLKKNFDWHSYSYRWADDQTDATLIPKEGIPGGSIGSGIADASKSEWQFPSRTQCRACHIPNGNGFSIGFTYEKFTNNNATDPVKKLLSVDKLKESGVLGVGAIRINKIPTSTRRSAQATLVWDFDPSKRKSDDLTGLNWIWFRQSSLKDLLTPWFSHSPTSNGFFRTQFDTHWTPTEEQAGSLAAQGSILYLMAMGVKETDDDGYRKAVNDGAKFLLTYYSDPVHGGFYESVDADGNPTDKQKLLINQAVAIRGLASAGLATGNSEYVEAAAKAWVTLKSKMYDPSTGWRTQAPEDFSKKSGCSQRALLLSFEALLALIELTGSEVLMDDAEEIVNFVFERLWREPGFVAEEYSDGWSNPIPFEGNRTTEPGHLAQWAYLLSESTRMGLPRRFLVHGQRLFDYLTLYDLDVETGTINDPESKQSPGTWQQAEFLRMLIRYADIHGRENAWPIAQQTQQWIMRQAIDNTNGGWYEIGSRDKGNLQRTGEHAMGMYVEGMRVDRERVNANAGVSK
jgi:mannose/cellobiose epimerase-like protein (N-acyl-D-glucosamine 2-epimerase family)